MQMLFIAVFTVLVAGVPLGTMRSPEPVAIEECMARLKNDRQMVLDVVLETLPDAEIVGECVPVGD
jgi:hypothetical protein